MMVIKSSDSEYANGLSLAYDSVSGFQSFFVRSPAPIRSGPDMNLRIMSENYEAGPVICIILTVDGNQTGYILINPLDNRKQVALRRLSIQDVVPVIYMRDFHQSRKLTMFNPPGNKLQFMLLADLHKTIIPSKKHVWDKAVAAFKKAVVGIW